MNATPHRKPGDDYRFDLLVDDELAEEDRRQLLSSLDGEPDGWRSCALAFLEAQAWKKELRTMVGGPAGPGREEAGGAAGAPAEDRPTVRESAAVAPAPPHGRWPRLVRTGLTATAMAASFLAALWLGLRWREWRHVGAPPTVDMVAASQQAGEPGAAAEPPEKLGPVAPLSTGSPTSPWQMVTLSAPEGSGKIAPVRLPARAHDHLDPQWLKDLPQAMPDDVRQALERTGHQVRQHRELLPLPMEDGRRLVVPVDQVDVHYVGNPTL